MHRCSNHELLRAGQAARIMARVLSHGTVAQRWGCQWSRRHSSFDDQRWAGRSFPGSRGGAAGRGRGAPDLFRSTGPARKPGVELPRTCGNARIPGMGECVWHPRWTSPSPPGTRQRSHFSCRAAAFFWASCWIAIHRGRMDVHGDGLDLQPHLPKKQTSEVLEIMRNAPDFGSLLAGNEVVVLGPEEDVR